MYTVPKLGQFTPEALDAAVAELTSALQAEAAAVRSETDWKTFRDRWMARKNGVLTQVNDLWLKAAQGPQKRDVGQRVNQLKALVAEIVESRSPRRALISFAEFEVPDVPRKKIDVTLPGIRRLLGAEHPVIRTMNEIVKVFRDLGYSVEEGPEIESDYYNFESLNFPPGHPARDTQDTIFLAGQEKRPERERLLLRTHTSPVQIRTMEKLPPPLRVVIPGKVYRYDTPDPTHYPVFHQVEGLAVDTNITFRDLKGTLDHAMKAFFGSSVKTRLQPSFSPSPSPAPRWRSPASSAAARGAASASTAAGWSCWAAAWWTPTSSSSCARTATTRRRSAVSHSAWAWSASPCSSGGSTTSSCSTRGTCGSWSSLRNSCQLSVVSEKT